MGTEKKFYGLVIPKKHEKVQPTRKSIFDSDSDDDGPPIPVRKPSDPPRSTEAKIVEQKLLNDDPSIYEYDNIYDSLKEKSAQKITEAKKKEPRFIQSLLKAAEKRKKDQDRRLEKKIQIERVKEGDEFKDKEAFVTSAYKQKMEEMEKDEERERIQNQLDEMMDVTKQNDLSGFYRHYLKQRVGEEKIPEFGEDPTLPAGVTIKTEPVESTCLQSKQRENREDKREKKPARNIRRRSSSSSDDSHDEQSHSKPLEASSSKTMSSRKHDDSARASKHTRYDTSSDDEYAPRKQSKKQQPVSHNHHSHEKDIGGKHEYSSKHIKPNTSSNDRKSDNHSRRRPSSPHEHSSRAKQSSSKHEHSVQDSKQKRLHRSSDSEEIEECSRKRPALSQRHSELKHSDRKYEHSKHGKHDISSDEEEHKTGVGKGTSSPRNYHSHAEQKASDSREANEDADDDDIVGSANEDNDDGDIVKSEKEDADDGDIVKSDSEPTRNDKKEKSTDMRVKFRKRTVGEVFDQAQARYFKRMAARGT